MFMLVVLRVTPQNAQIDIFYTLKALINQRNSPESIERKSIS